ncbi:MAG: helicase, partial [candidate division KSB1 bacterium]|nr:helicase [candidate division KSB1 bacterium]
PGGEKLAVIFRKSSSTRPVTCSIHLSKDNYSMICMRGHFKSEDLEKKVEEVLNSFREQVRESRESTSILGPTEALNPQDAQQLLAHPLPYWIERMTVNYLRANGGKATQENGAWNVTWPDGESMNQRGFSSKS